MRFYRSQSERMLGGVCGGLAAYTGIDVTWVRLFWVLLSLSNQTFTLVYFILWMVTPEEDQVLGDLNSRITGIASDVSASVRHPNPQAGMIVGVALIISGAFVLLDNLNIPGLAWLGSDMLWPVLLIIGGVALLTRRARGLEEETEYEG